MSEPSPIVLVVDDEVQIRRFLRTGFELNGFVVHEAGTGAEAIRSATLRPIDLAIIDLAARAVTLNGTLLTLTPKEYRLLQVLAQHAGNVVTHQHLLKEVWGSIHVHDTHYLRIFVRKLRQKIEPHPDSPKILVTELGVGYRLAQAGNEPENGVFAAAEASAKSEG